MNKSIKTLEEEARIVRKSMKGITSPRKLKGLRAKKISISAQILNTQIEMIKKASRKTSKK